MCWHQQSLREEGNGEIKERTIRLNSVGELPAASHGERSATSSPGKSHKEDNGLLLQKYRRSKAAKHADPGLGLNSGLGLKGVSEPIEDPFVGEYHRGKQKLAGHEMESLLRNTDSTSITTMYSES